MFDPAYELVLLIKHRGTGQWQFPGGHVDPDETAAGCALREVLEETGVRATLWTDDRLDIPGGFWHPSPLMTVEFPAPADPEWGEPAHHHIDLLFVATANPGAPLTLQDEEVTGGAWVPLENLIPGAPCRPDVPPAAAAALALVTR